MPDKPIHGVAGGETAAGTDANALRFNSFNFGVGYRDYGETPVTGYYSVLDPPSSGGSGPGEFGSTAGCAIYSYKASEGPSIVVFSGGTGVNEIFPIRTTDLAGATYSTVPNAIQWYMTTAVTDTVISNRFKTIPKIGNLSYFFDVNQWLCVPPSLSTDYQIYGSGKDLSLNNYAWSFVQAVSGSPVGLYGWHPSAPTELPWFLDFGTDAQERGYIDTGVTDLLKTSTSFTISIWVRVAAINAGAKLFSFLDDVGNAISISLADEGSGIVGVSCNLNPGGAGNVNLSAELGSVPVNWANIVLTNSSEYGYALYVSGDFQSSTTYQTIEIGNTEECFIMDATTYVPVRFNSLAIWNTGFSATDVSLLFDLQSIEFRQVV